MKVIYLSLFFIVCCALNASANQTFEVEVYENKGVFGQNITLELTMTADHVLLDKQIKYEVRDPNLVIITSKTEDIPYLYLGQNIYIRQIQLPSEGDDGQWVVSASIDNMTAAQEFSVIYKSDVEYSLPWYIFLIIIIVAAYLYVLAREPKK